MYINTIRNFNFFAICLSLHIYLMVKCTAQQSQVESEINSARSKSCVLNTNFNFFEDSTIEEYDRREICSPLICPGAYHKGYPSTPILEHRFRRYLNTLYFICNNFQELNSMQKENLINLRSAIYLLCNSQDPSPTFLGFQCPDTAEIDPCICDKTTVPTLDCSNVGSFTQVKNILDTATFPNTNFQKFNYKPETPNINETIFPNNTFGPLSFETIAISSSGVRVIEHDAFNGSQTILKKLSLDLNKNLQIFPFRTLTDFVSLNLVSIVDADINEIPTLGTIHNLKVFNVISSKVKQVQSDAFTNLREINLIDLSLNDLESVGLVSSGWHLSSGNISVYLDSNNLLTISNFACNQPIILDASSNSLSTFSEAVYKPLLDIGAIINVQINNISCSEFGWVTPTEQRRIISDC